VPIGSTPMQPEEHPEDPQYSVRSACCCSGSSRGPARPRGGLTATSGRRDHARHLPIVGGILTAAFLGIGPYDWHVSHGPVAGAEHLTMPRSWSTSSIPPWTTWAAPSCQTGWQVGAR
jgi:hypothetical protein